MMLRVFEFRDQLLFLIKFTTCDYLLIHKFSFFVLEIGHIDNMGFMLTILGNFQNIVSYLLWSHNSCPCDRKVLRVQGALKIFFCEGFFYLVLENWRSWALSDKLDAVNRTNIISMKTFLRST